MPRSVEEWRGRNDDSPIPDRVRLRIFLHYSGICQICERKLHPPADAWICDHKVALCNGGENRETNLQVLCLWCNKKKTTNDVAKKAMTYLKQKAHYGLKKSRNPMPGSRRSKWKRKMNGTIVRRNADA